VGDLSEPLFGMGRQNFEILGEILDVIIHCGAMVNGVFSYMELKPTNVLGTQEILRLAVTGGLKPVNYISTIGVFGGLQTIYETSELTAEYLPFMSGYSQSKWVAEKLVWEGKKRDIPISIFRPGTLFCDNITGRDNPVDFVHLLLCGIISLGAWPDVNRVWNLAPVDWAAKTIIGLSNYGIFSQTKQTPDVIHIVNTCGAISFEKLMELVDQFGFKTRKLPYLEWREGILSQPGNPLLPLKSYFDFNHFPNNVNISSTFTKEMLSSLNFNQCPEISQEIVHKNLGFLVENGHIHK